MTTTTTNTGAASLIDRLCGQLAAAAHFASSKDFDKKEALALIEEARAAIAAAGAQEPIYQLKLASGDWRDQDESSYRYNLQHPSNVVRIVYAAPLPREAATVALTDGWISADERLPECRTECTSSGTDVSNTVYLLGDSIGGYRGYGIGHLQSDGKWVCYDGEHDFMCITCVTHWMPLPAAPAESTGAPK